MDHTRCGLGVILFLKGDLTEAGPRAASGAGTRPPADGWSRQPRAASGAGLDGTPMHLLRIEQLQAHHQEDHQP